MCLVTCVYYSVSWKYHSVCSFLQLYMSRQWGPGLYYSTIWPSATLREKNGNAIVLSFPSLQDLWVNFVCPALANSDKWSLSFKKHSPSNERVVVTQHWSWLKVKNHLCLYTTVQGTLCPSEGDIKLKMKRESKIFVDWFFYSHFFFVPLWQILINNHHLWRSTVQVMSRVRAGLCI